MSAPATAAVVAATRFGYAARGDDLAVIAKDPHAWVLRQLDRAPAQPLGELPRSPEMVAAMLEARRDKDPDQRKALGERIRNVNLAEVSARMTVAAESDTPFLERLVHFWSNHFTVSGFRPVVRGFAAAFEREAIRPHVTGRFTDLLLAAEHHPAMLLYLDNALSIRPNSVGGRRRNKGINENLGREILELHTLGVDGGYTQTDVEALANILTGWTIARLEDPDPGTFRFVPQIHEPGAKTLLGRTYAEAGMEEGEVALRDLAHHPATARHIATKLARHFIADQPPKDAVERIAKVFRDSDGDLKQVSATVVREEAIWRQPFAKLRKPCDFVIAACRVGGFMPPPPLLMASLRALDEPSFLAPSPAGWPDDAAPWASPEAVLHRASWCETYAERIPDPPDPAPLAAAALGECLSAETAEAIRHAPTRRLGLALLLASPEFQRR